MAWSITADPERFDEAMRWFTARVLLTKDEAIHLDDESLQRSFWVGAGLQLTQVQRVFDEIQHALETGESFAEFKKRMARTLRDPAHAETVFRNATQRAYNAGRYQQMREVARWRPFWRFDAILDSRTTAICTARDGVVLHANSDWWKRNWPPLHHRCRSAVRSQREGVITVPPNLPDTPGWGLSPENDPVWKPDPTKHDPVLIRELEKKQKKPPKPRLKRKPEHKPSHWAAEYKAFGDAGSSLAYGRAAYERGLDRTAGELRAELLRLKAEGHPAVEGLDLTELERLPQDRPLRGTLFGERKRGLVALAEHTRSVKVGDRLGLVGETPKAIREANRFYELSLAKAVKRPTGWRVEYVRGARAYASPASKRIVLGDRNATGIAVHEIAHAVEFSDAKTLRRSLAFLEARTKGEGRSKLRELFPGRGYRDDERARPDKFLSAYMGKDYGELATEITSMGYEQITRDVELLASRDPEMLYFLLGQLAGK